MSSRIEAEEFHEVGDRVAVPIRHRARGGSRGVEVEIRIGHLWTVREGKIIRLEVFPAREMPAKQRTAPLKPSRLPCLLDVNEERRPDDVGGDPGEDDALREWVHT
jgi:hypothetical protein